MIIALVAGLLGDKPPTPLNSNSLTQSVEWDGKDDAGRPTKGKPFKARVRLGMKPELEGFLLENPASTGAIWSLAGPQLELGLAGDHDPPGPARRGVFFRLRL